MKTRKIMYWACTGILEFVLLAGGLSNISHQQWNVDGIVTHLGYPLFFLTIIGVWKVLGGIAILFHRCPRLQEWAYAGVFFELSGAVVSHLAVGDGIGKAIFPAVFAGFGLLSWALKPVVKSRETSAGEVGKFILRGTV